MALLWALLPYSSYSEPYTYGTTGNVAIVPRWDMSTYLPNIDSTDINGVLYRYTTIKDTDSDMLVHIQNKDTQGSGYIFRETDDWSGLPSATINKLVLVDNIPASRFGEGSIEVEGDGQVTNHTVMYNYRIDNGVAEVTPQEIPDIPEIELYNALEDSAVSSSEAPVAYSDEEEGDGTAEEEERQERALRASKDSVGIGSSLAQQAMMAALTINTLGRYEALQIDGGIYKENVSLTDAKLPENRQGLRNGLAQQILHTKMVDAQYGERP